ncbi:hypothetical protein BS47DRAFT_1213664 [Hydnum rufescens UP504]|uniref:Uncharacterized protein n=1 Tax=Hydnum rufescens UP504 TaxID=1448309 RepID=A0A9P6AS49_9AGAM|nr:hypothetical protein BS47DRAFT_1213664 [Hydnum rufescens UP504]
MQHHIPHSSLSSMDRPHHSDERQQHFIQSEIVAGPSHASPHPMLIEKFDDSSIPRIRKKGGRGPGKKDSKDKTGISVRYTPFPFTLPISSTTTQRVHCVISPDRWEEADLTDRLINALHSNDLWAGVFIATSTAEHSRAVIGMPKSDLQREIARYLFHDDPRFDLDDSRTIDLLGTSVKNKVNKIRKLYNECKDELGSAANTLNDEHDISPDSDLSRVWARVKDKLPQFFQVRDIMNRPVVSAQALDMSPIADSPTGGGGFRGLNRSVSTPFPIETGGMGYTASPILSPIQSNNGRQHSSYPRYYPLPSLLQPSSFLCFWLLS